MLLHLYRAIYIECKNLVYKDCFWVSYSGLDFSGPRLRSWSFCFCVSILLLAFLSVHCVSPYQRFHNPRRISTLKTKNIIFCVYLLDHNLSFSMDRQFEEDRKMVSRMKISKYLSKGKIFLVPTLSVSPLCPRTSKCLSMGRR
jgi:hypothetical protein